MKNSRIYRWMIAINKKNNQQLINLSLNKKINLDWKENLHPFSFLLVSRISLKKIMLKNNQLKFLKTRQLKIKLIKKMILIPNQKKFKKKQKRKNKFLRKINFKKMILKCSLIENKKRKKSYKTDKKKFINKLHKINKKKWKELKCKWHFCHTKIQIKKSRK